MSRPFVVLPIFLMEQDSFWSTDQAAAILRDFLQEFAPLGREGRLAAFTNSDMVVRQAAEAGVTVRMLQAGFKEEPPLPPGTAAAMRCLDRLGLDLGEGPLAVMDFRNLFLDRTILEQAADAFDLSRFPAMASVCESRDLPCQLKRFYDVIDNAGLILLFDPPTRPGHAPTPLTTLARTLSMHQASGWLEVADGSPRLTAKARGEVSRLLGELRIDPALEPVGAAASTTKGIDSPLLVGKKGAGALSVLIPQKMMDRRGDLDLKLVPLGLDGPLYSRALELEIRRGCERSEIPAPEKDVAGYLFMTHVMVENETYLTTDVFTSTQGEWIADPFLERTLSKSSSRAISGRQESPPVYEFNGALFLLPLGNGRPGERAAKWSRLPLGAQPFVMPLGRSVTVRSGLDFLRYQAKLKSPCSS